jgi:TM2 domain-containing membrane protein YozV
MWRATLELARGNIAASLSYHLLCIPVTLAVILALIWLLKDVFKNQETFFIFLSQRFSLSTRVLLFAVIVFCWVVNIVRRV